MKKLRKLKYFIGIDVACSKKVCARFSQRNIKIGCKTLGNHKIECEESPIIEKSQYQILVGKLVYLSHTRPNISYIIGVIIQFMHDPIERHIQRIYFLVLHISRRKSSNIEEQQAKFGCSF
ncbi:hypothetical protein CR513_50188, partial [Mucuna pruriens]